MEPHGSRGVRSETLTLSDVTFIGWQTSGTDPLIPREGGSGGTAPNVVIVFRVLARGRGAGVALAPQAPRAAASSSAGTRWPSFLSMIFPISTEVAVVNAIPKGIPPASRFGAQLPEVTGGRNIPGFARRNPSWSSTCSSRADRVF